MKFYKIVAVLIIGISSFSMISTFAEDDIIVEKTNPINSKDIPLLNQLPNDDLEATEEDVPDNESEQESVDEQGELPDETPEEEIVQPLYENIQQLEAHEIIVKDYEEFKSAIQGSENGFTTIYLGADITFGNVGVVVHPQKNSFIIDGTDPITGVRHRINEYATAKEISSSIYSLYNTNGNSQIELRNVDIYGQGQYGIVSIASFIQNLTVKFSNVNYVGPQIATNHNGKIIIRNSTLTGVKNNYFAPVQELAGEVNSAVFEGNVTINHTTATAIGVFSFKGTNPSVTIKEGAHVVINTDRNFESSTTYATAFYGEPNSSFELNAVGGAEIVFAPQGLYLNNSKVYLSVSGTSTNYIYKNEVSTKLENNSIFDITFSGIINQNSIIQKGDFIITDSVVNYTATENSRIYNGIWGIENPKFKNSDFNIEVAGTVTSPGSTMFINSQTFLLDNSNLTINAYKNSGCFLYVHYGTAFTMINASKVKLYSKRLESEVSLVRLQANLTIPEGGEFTSYIEYSYTDVPLLQIAGNLVVEPNTIVELTSNSGFTKHLIQFMGVNRSIIVDNPRLFLMFYRSSNTETPFGSNVASPINFVFTGQQINQWRSIIQDYSQSGNFANPPAHVYVKKNESDYYISGVIASVSSVMVNSTNYNSAEDSLNPSTNLSFKTADSRQFSIGRLDATIDSVGENDTHISGTATKNSNIQFTYQNKQTGALETVEGVSDNNGNFNIQTGSIGKASYDFKVNKKFLYLSKPGQVEEQVGRLEFLHVPETISFGPVGIPTKQTLYSRFDPSWAIDIEDSRAINSSWTLFAQILQPTLISSDPTKPNLPGRLIFIDKNGNRKVMSGLSIIATKPAGELISKVTWGANRGILLEVDPGKVYKDVTYSTTIIWILTDAP